MIGEVVLGLIVVYVVLAVRRRSNLRLAELRAAGDQWYLDRYDELIAWAEKTAWPNRLELAVGALDEDVARALFPGRYTQPDLNTPFEALPCSDVAHVWEYETLESGAKKASCHGCDTVIEETTPGWYDARQPGWRYCPTCEAYRYQYQCHQIHGSVGVASVIRTADRDTQAGRCINDREHDWVTEKVHTGDGRFIRAMHYCGDCKASVTEIVIGEPLRAQVRPAASAVDQLRALLKEKHEAMATLAESFQRDSSGPYFTLTQEQHRLYLDLVRSAEQVKRQLAIENQRREIAATASVPGSRLYVEVNGQLIGD